MSLRESACVLILASVFAAGCTTPTPKQAPGRYCDRVETAWDEEEERVVMIEHDCKTIDPTEEIRVWVLLWQILGAALGIAAIVL